MANPLTPSRRIAPRPDDDPAETVEEPSAVAPWLAVVVEKVKTMRYGVVQVIVHDSKVVQIERTERTRFDVPQSNGHR